MLPLPAMTARATTSPGRRKSPSATSRNTRARRTSPSKSVGRSRRRAEGHSSKTSAISAPLHLGLETGGKVSAFMPALSRHPATARLRRENILLRSRT
ncbi:hypothetical protein AGR9A_Lc40204 [Agrobacterium salinitolerans str. Hayward 0363]|nr:hypothetical protein AGR9A_Lc40204 [Agrobacterium salinitolerans str. Hayward 0363]